MIGKILYGCLIAALILLTTMLTIEQFIIPNFGVCVEKVDKHIHCTLGPFAIISKEEIE